ncbi:MAG: GNAT family N-acetyltransferase [Burkholderiaceae bacterium]|nr:GNAT family N-acetyltransferase [Burkholderiaceae bacterium]
MAPLRQDADWFAEPGTRSHASELQAYYEANPEYWRLVHGHPPPPGEAEEGFDFKPPEMPYRSLPVWLIRERVSGRLIADLWVATDLLAPGVSHLGFFLIERARQGSGFADELHEAYEAWARGDGARWLRLGVVENNRRATAFWRRMGYVEVTRRGDVVIGALTHQLRIMVKVLPGSTLDDYLAAVPRDRAVA